MTPMSPGLSADRATAEFELANRLFFRLYQCANILHKTGTKAVESEGLTTQRWAVMGALSRPEATDGMAAGDLAGYLQVSRQSLAGVVGPLISADWVEVRRSAADGRVRRYALTEAGRMQWTERALPRIERFYADATAGMSLEDVSHALHYLVRLIDNMSSLDDRT